MKGVLLVLRLIKINKQGGGGRVCRINWLLYSLMIMKVVFRCSSCTDLVDSFEKVLENVCAKCLCWECIKIYVRKN